MSIHNIQNQVLSDGNTLETCIRTDASRTLLGLRGFLSDVPTPASQCFHNFRCNSGSQWYSNEYEGFVYHISERQLCPDRCEGQNQLRSYPIKDADCSYGTQLTRFTLFFSYGSFCISLGWRSFYCLLLPFPKQARERYSEDGLDSFYHGVLPLSYPFRTEQSYRKKAEREVQSGQREVYANGGISILL